MKVVLFDIDGTLLNSDGAGREAMETALTEIFGTPGPRSYRYGGKTDRLIVRETMRLEGFDDTTIDARMQDVTDRYLFLLRESLAEGRHTARALEGVFALLQAVEQDAGMVLGLLTGNLVEGAGVKLRAVEIDPSRFRLGAYGSDHEDRPELPPIAQARASALLGEAVAGERLVIIGDTPHDVTCGRGIGAKAIAVATGGFSRQELESHGPAAAFDTLRDTAGVLEAIRNA